MSVQIRCAALTALDDAGTVVASKLRHASSSSFDKNCEPALRAPLCDVLAHRMDPPPEPSPSWLKVVSQCIQKAFIHLRSTVAVNVGETVTGVDIVQSDHAPEAGVTQGIFHGDLIRHQGGHQEELGEELEEEVERRVRRDHSSNQTQVRMHG